MVKHIEKMKHHANRFRGAVSEAVEAVTNPGSYVPETEVVIDRPNYLLVGLQAPHVYGFPDAGHDVRVCAINDTDKRRVDRNNMLHYDPREYKPMTMERKYRRL